jgi:hypothetical protein
MPELRGSALQNALNLPNVGRTPSAPTQPSPFDSHSSMAAAVRHQIRRCPVTIRGTRANFPAAPSAHPESMRLRSQPGISVRRTCTRYGPGIVAPPCCTDRERERTRGCSRSRWFDEQQAGSLLQLPLRQAASRCERAFIGTRGLVPVRAAAAPDPAGAPARGPVREEFRRGLSEARDDVPVR